MVHWLVYFVIEIVINFYFVVFLIYEINDNNYIMIGWKQ